MNWDDVKRSIDNLFTDEELAEPVYVWDGTKYRRVIDIQNDEGKNCFILED